MRILLVTEDLPAPILAGQANTRFSWGTRLLKPGMTSKCSAVCGQLA